jgi:Pyruvate/2-oxoacid:ferredoxin oxidoreductase delta subunit
MSRTSHKALAEALDSLPNGYPPTESGVEVRLLERIFSDEEAALGRQLTGAFESVDIIAERAGLEVKPARKLLMGMTRRGLVWLGKEEGKAGFRLAPFVVGIYEAQVDTIDRELSELFEQYMANGGANGILEHGPALHRVVPAERAVQPEWVLPYDDVRAILQEAETFQVNDCICRKERAQTGHECDFPVENCLSFSKVKRAPRKGDISKEEALELLDDAAAIGLVHTVSNNQEVGYVCNCCGCCCAILRGINEWGIQNSVANANYIAVMDHAKCEDCERCELRCPVDAIMKANSGRTIDLERCIGCGVCVTGCNKGAIRLERKRAEEIVEPPADFSTWERQRLSSRGMI